MSIERNAGYYDEIYSNPDSGYRLSYFDSTYYNLWKRVLLLIPKTDLTVLEVGCGTGQFAEMLLDQRSNITYRGIDFSDVAIKAANQLGNSIGIFFTTESAYDCKISIDDFIICLETLEHIDDFKFIERIPMGVEIVFTVPDFNDPAHVRYFKNINEIVTRYSRHLDFSHCEKFDSWFVCKAHRI